MGLFSKVGSFLGSVGSAVVGGAKNVWRVAKETAAKAIVWMADGAESVIGEAKELWRMAEPYVAKARKLLQSMAQNAPHPWLRGLAGILDGLLGALQVFVKGDLANKLESALRWCITVAQKLRETFLSKEQAQEARQRKETFTEAQQHASPEQRHALDLAALINNYVLVQSGIKTSLDGAGVDDFEHFLRLRATQKLLNRVEGVLRRAKSVDDISSDDIFLVATGSALLEADPALSDAEVERLDGIVESIYGKKLIPFVFEEMILIWNEKWKKGEVAWTEANQKAAKDRSLLRRLLMEQRLATLNEEDSTILLGLQDSVEAETRQLNELAANQRYLHKYVGAAEGFLQMLEQDAETLEAEGKGFLAEEGSRVGMLIIACVQKGKPWSELTEEEQSLITDFANIFEQDSQARADQLIEVTVD